MWNSWKHCWLEDFTEEKVNSKVSCLSFVLIAMKLVKLQQDVHKIRTIEKETSKKIEEKVMEEIIKAKAESVALLKKTLMKMMIK